METKMITAEELIESLRKLPPKLVVLKSSDDEGNSYSFIDEFSVQTAAYEETDGEIEVGIPELTKGMVESGYTEDDIKPHKCIVIY